MPKHLERASHQRDHINKYRTEAELELEKNVGHNRAHSCTYRGRNLV